MKNKIKTFHQYVARFLFRLSGVADRHSLIDDLNIEYEELVVKKGVGCQARNDRITSGHRHE